MNKWGILRANNDYSINSILRDEWATGISDEGSDDAIGEQGCGRREVEKGESNGSITENYIWMHMCTKKEISKRH